MLRREREQERPARARRDSRRSVERAPARPTRTTFAPDEPLGLFSVLDLLADGDAKAFLQSRAM
jgi:hypothetical protein